MVFTYRKNIFSVVIVLCCFFKSTSPYYIETFFKNAHDKQLDEKLAKPVFSFARSLNGLLVDYWCYTTELSRLLLVGEPQIFQTLQWAPIIGGLTLLGPLFDNRFENFVHSAKTSSLHDLQEAIIEAILLSPCSSKAYSVTKLLDYLIEILEEKIVHIQNQLEHHSTWDQKSVTYMKKSVALFATLLAAVIIIKQYIPDYKKQEHKEIDLFESAEQRISRIDKNVKKEVSNIEGINALATLACVPAFYKVVKGSYKLLTTDPNAYNECLETYQELLLFVQNIKSSLIKNGYISFELASGVIAKVKDGQLFFEDQPYRLIFGKK